MKLFAILALVATSSAFEISSRALSAPRTAVQRTQARAIPPA